MLAVVGCSPVPAPLQSPPQRTAVLTGGANRSMVFLAWTAEGVVVIDLGWFGAERQLRAGLAEIGARTSDVAAVFLTHSHRDHIGAWRLLRDAPFHLAAPEQPLLLGRAAHGGLIPRLADRLLPPDLPQEGELELRVFSSDTAFVFGSDTLRAFLVPGHTRGSAAYLFEGVLFAGDALARPPRRGFRSALPGYSDDVAQGSRSLADLWLRVAPFRVEYVCTAHAKCAPFTPALVRDTSLPRR